MIEPSLSVSPFRRVAASGLRFLLSAGLVWAVDMVVFILSHDWLGSALALLLARLAGGAAGFVLHKTVSFQDSAPLTLRQFASYWLLWLANYAISLSVLSGLTLLVPEHVVVGKAITDVIIFVTNYLILRLVFRRR